MIRRLWIVLCGAWSAFWLLLAAGPIQQDVAAEPRTFLILISLPWIPLAIVPALARYVFRRY